MYPGVDGRISYGYDGFNRQTSAGGAGTTSTYTYGPGGLRTGKTVGGQTTSYVWDGQEVVLEQGAATTAYLRGLNLIASIGSATSYYLYNAHGDVVQLTDTAGAVTKEYKYDAFGVEQNPSAGDVNPFRYCGEQYDSETGSIYLRARYYDVLNGRFTSEDSVRARKMNVFDPYGNYQSTILKGGLYQDGKNRLHVVNDPLSLNLYTYTINNPIKFTDPSGNKPKLGTPPPSSSGYVPPKGGAKQGKTTSGQKGWVDKNGNVWVPDDSDHGGDHWDVNRKDGKGHSNVYPDGTVRKGSGTAPNLPKSNKDQQNISVADGVVVAVGVIIVWQGVKWAVAAVLAAATGGGSLVLAAVTP